MPFSKNNGVSIWYEVSGEGPPLILIHANPFDNQMWMYQVAHFSAKFKVISVDLRGYGRSVKMTEEFTLEDMANDVLGVMEDAGCSKAVVMGCSVGSAIAILLTLSHPHMFEASILVGGSSDVSSRFPRRIAGYINDITTYHCEFMRDLFHPNFVASQRGKYIIDTFIEKQGWLNAESIAATLRATNSLVTTQRLHSLRVPTLVINGEVDNSRPAGELTASLIPNAQHKIIEGAGHACCLEEPEIFDGLVKAFLVEKGLWPNTKSH